VVISPYLRVLTFSMLVAARTLQMSHPLLLQFWTLALLTALRSWLHFRSISSSLIFSSLVPLIYLLHLLAEAFIFCLPFQFPILHSLPFTDSLVLVFSSAFSTFVCHSYILHRLSLTVSLIVGDVLLSDLYHALLCNLLCVPFVSNGSDPLSSFLLHPMKKFWPLKGRKVKN
jgi:hypothetical protein